MVKILNWASLPYGLNTVNNDRLLPGENTNSLGDKNTGNSIFEVSLSENILLELLILAIKICMKI